MAGKIPESEKNGRRSRRHPDASDAKTDTQVGFGSEDEVSGWGSSLRAWTANASALDDNLLLVVVTSQPHSLACLS